MTKHLVREVKLEGSRVFTNRGCLPSSSPLVPLRNQALKGEGMLRGFS